MDRKGNWIAPFMACAVPLALLATYVGGYFMLPKVNPGTRHGTPLVFRTYQNERMPKVYWPLGKLEGAITGTEVVLRYE